MRTNNNAFDGTVDSSSIIDLSNRSTIGYFQESITTNWDKEAYTDLQGSTLLYRELAMEIERLHILFRSVDLKPGDKVAICAKNCSNWAVAFFAIFTYGAVPVPILADFKADYIHNIVNHSESKLLFAGDSQWKSISPEKMPEVIGFLQVSDRALLHSTDERLTKAYENLDALFKERFPQGFNRNDIEFYLNDNPQDLAVLNYTSGTTSLPKGVMIPYRALRALIIYSLNTLPLKNGTSTVCMLPLAHMFGLMFELIYGTVLGCHIHFLTKIPSPRVIFQAFAEFKPSLIISVPLVIEKVVRTIIMPELQKPAMRVALHTPILRGVVIRKVRQKLMDAFGGSLVEIIIGGAALGKDVEDCLRMLNFPFSVGYGTTECAPLVAYSHWFDYKPGTCGRPIDCLEIKIHSTDPENIPGEITIRGDNVMLGYFKNPEATAQAIDKDGWFYSGDMGTIDKEGNITIKGRCKNMILGPSGQNIYPEEIEEVINAIPLVAESIVIDRDEKLIALIVPDPEIVRSEKLSRQQIAERLDAHRKEINTDLPSYERINSFQIMDEPFEKTPKGSIKRFLYQDK